METKAQENQNQDVQPVETETKHVISFAVMIVMTAISFGAVIMDVIPIGMVIPIILVLALIQVMMQFFTFMHLDYKKEKMTVTFVMSGLLFALICVLGVALIS